MKPRSPSQRLGVLAAALGALPAGCSNEGPVPFCENCELWSQVTAG